VPNPEEYSEVIDESDVTLAAALPHKGSTLQSWFGNRQGDEGQALGVACGPRTMSVCPMDGASGRPPLLGELGANEV
jgi:hypothetical protein